MRLIDANALLPATVAVAIGKGLFVESRIVYYDEIEAAPTVDPVKHGRWIGEGDGYADGEMVYDVWYCSECDHCIDDGTDNPKLLPNYCPHCGAKMDL